MYTIGSNGGFRVLSRRSHGDVVCFMVRKLNLNTLCNPFGTIRFRVQNLIWFFLLTLSHWRKYHVSPSRVHIKELLPPTPPPAFSKTSVLENLICHLKRVITVLLKNSVRGRRPTSSSTHRSKAEGPLPSKESLCSYCLSTCLFSPFLVVRSYWYVLIQYMYSSVMNTEISHV